ncbi:MAG: hypothetical protein IJW77_01830 [Clostridia bacterium]|nr:hypothetical protein [Clostridia bacterium]
MKGTRKYKAVKKSAAAYSLIEYTAKGVSLSDTGDDNTEQSAIGHTVETVAAQQKYRKKAIQKKYAKQYRQERWQGFKNRIKKEVQKLISNPVGYLVGKGAGLGITLGIALGLILSLPSFLTIGGMVLGGAGIAMSTCYLAEEQEILAVESAYSQRENIYVQTILHFAPAYDEWELHDRGVSYSHDPHALAAWMTVLLGDFDYGSTEATLAMNQIFNAQYSYRTEYEATTKKINGQDVPWNILKVYVDQKPLVDAAEDSLSDEDYERFKIIYDNRGGMPDIFQ